MQLLAVTPLLALLAQAAPAAAPAPYRVGPGDVIEVAVDGRPDLSRLPTVPTTGSVWLPRAGDVEVRGLTTAEIAARVAPLLTGADLQAPRVAVRVAEYHSQFVWVMGAVNRPGRKPLRGTTRLIDLLINAGGLKPTALGEITITRTEGSFESGKDTLQVTLSASGLSAQDRVLVATNRNMRFTVSDLQIDVFMNRVERGAFQAPVPPVPISAILSLTAFAVHPPAVFAAARPHASFALPQAPLAWRPLQHDP